MPGPGSPLLIVFGGLPGLVQPSWQDVVNRAYEPWDREHLVLDTAMRSIDQLVDCIETLIRDKGP